MAKALFYGYAAVLVVAGATGAVAAKTDMLLLLHERTGSVDLLSQYRFLRGIELGFGLFAFVFRNEIFAETKHRRVFLFGMASGLGARFLGMAFDGLPSRVMIFFALYELVALIAIVTEHAHHDSGALRTQ